MSVPALSLVVMGSLQGRPVLLFSEDDPRAAGDSRRRFRRLQPILFSRSLLAGAVTSGCFTLVGFCLLILPGIYLGVAYLFTYLLLIVDQKLDFWTAMEVSRRVVTTQWWRVLGLGLVGILFLLLGLSLFLVVGIPRRAAPYVPRRHRLRLRGLVQYPSFFRRAVSAAGSWIGAEQAPWSQTKAAGRERAG